MCACVVGLRTRARVCVCERVRVRVFVRARACACADVAVHSMRARPPHPPTNARMQTRQLHRRSSAPLFPLASPPRLRRGHRPRRRLRRRVGLPRRRGRLNAGALYGRAKAGRRRSRAARWGVGGGHAARSGAVGAHGQAAGVRLHRRQVRVCARVCARVCVHMRAYACVHACVLRLRTFSRRAHTHAHAHVLPRTCAGNPRCAAGELDVHQPLSPAIIVVGDAVAMADDAAAVRAAAAAAAAAADLGEAT